MNRLISPLAAALLLCGPILAENQSSAIAPTTAAPSATPSAASSASPTATASGSVEETVKQILSQMTLEEKVEQLNIQPEKSKKQPGLGSRSQLPNDRLKIFPLRATNGPRGPHSSGKRPANRSTSVTTAPVSPTELCVASSWNPELQEATGRQWGLLTKDYGLNALWGPCINMIKDPRAGRNTDNAGEDPFQTGAFAVAAIKGIQSAGVAAVAKHFAANNWETGRQSHDVHVPLRSLHELYLPAFRMCVEEGNVAGIMTCYNAINGVWGSANKDLMLDLVRHEWGFKGFFVSDWGAHLGSAAQAIKAGQNLELPGQDQLKLAAVQKALATGDLTMADIDARVAEVLRAKFEMIPYHADEAPSGYQVEDFKQVIRKVGDEGMVLLKNNPACLPLAKTQSVALIGPFAADADYTIGNAGSSTLEPSYVVTLKDALEARGIKVAYDKGDCDGFSYEGAQFTNAFPCRVEFFNGQDLAGQPVKVQDAPSLTLGRIEADTSPQLIEDGFRGKAFHSSGQTRMTLGQTPTNSAWSVNLMVRLADQFPEPKKTLVVMSNSNSVVRLTSSQLEVQNGKFKQTVDLDWRDMNHRWLPLLFVYTGNSVKLYRENDLIAEIPGVDKLTQMSIAIGNQPQGLPLDVDELTTWDQALTPQQVKDTPPLFLESFENFSPNIPHVGIPGIKDTLNLSARVSGKFTPARPGKVMFKMESNGGLRVRIDGQLIYDLWDEQKAGGTKNYFWYEFNDVRPREMVIEFASKHRSETGFLKMSYASPPETTLFTRAVAAAKSSDVAVVCVGVPSHQQEENIDRPTFALPSWQDELIQAVTAANPKTIVVLFTEGGADVTPWIDKVPAVVQAFHPGSEGGNIITDILYGDVNPSGKLTVTWPKSQSDLPTTGPDSHYKDTVNEFGYRYFDKHEKSPRFPFGYGLSYTTFEYESLTARTSTNSLYPVTATVAVKNSGGVAGKEVIQIYVANTHSTVEQPVKKLAGFAKVELKPGESKTVEIPLHWTAFKFFDVKTKTWVLEPGPFDIMAARSSQDVAKTVSVTLQ